MKKNTIKIIATIVLIFVSKTAYSQAFSKDDPVGTVIEYQKGDKADNIERMTLVQKESTAHGDELTIQFGKGDVQMKCLRTDDEIIWDPRNLALMIKKAIDDEDIKLRVRAKGDGFVIPLQPKLNDKYRDLKFKLTFSIYGLKPKVNIMVLDREVIRREVVETPMGSFDTYLLRSKWRLNIKFLLIINETEDFEMYQWIAPGLGVIKEITTDEDDFENATPEILINKYMSKEKATSN